MRQRESVQSICTLAYVRGSPNEMACCANPMRELLHVRTRKKAGEHDAMKTMRLSVKRGLFVLFEMTVFAALCFSSNIPSFLRLAGNEEWTASGLVAVPVSLNSVVAPDGPQHRAAKESKSRSLGPKSARGIDRKGPQATSVATDRKYHGSSDRAVVVARKPLQQHKHTTAQKESN